MTLFGKEKRNFLWRDISEWPISQDCDLKDLPDCVGVAMLCTSYTNNPKFCNFENIDV